MSPLQQPAPPASLDQSEMRASYDAYFASGLYATRYPRPNPNTLQTIAKLLPRGGALMDYGSGEGRYCLALAASHQARILAVDISAVAREGLRDAATQFGASQQITACDPADDAYLERLDSASLDVILIAFGTLGHIAGRANRLALLREFRGMLKPDGRLVLGLPNAARRLRDSQRQCRDMVARGELEPGDVRYSRAADGMTISLYYHLFTEAEFRRDLVEAGFAIESVTSESILPESMVTHSRILSGVDAIARATVPRAFCYGFLVTARPA